MSVAVEAFAPEVCRTGAEDAAAPTGPFNEALRWSASLVAQKLLQQRV
jgi:hypothetical protein